MSAMSPGMIEDNVDRIIIFRRRDKKISVGLADKAEAVPVETLLAIRQKVIAGNNGTAFKMKHRPKAAFDYLYFLTLFHIRKMFAYGRAVIAGCGR